MASYHADLLAARTDPETAQGLIPPQLRRMTVREAAVLQGFPPDFTFKGQAGKQYRQIGNAVPCGLAEAVAKAAVEAMRDLAG